MKKLNEIEIYDEEQRKRDHVVAIQIMIEQQLNVYAKLMENNSSEVMSPLSYNACIGLLEQLRTHSFAAFAVATGIAPQMLEGVGAPLFKINYGD
jgi:hypothetical protein